VNNAIDQVENEFGPIHVLVNCAGIVGGRPILMENYSNFRRVMDTNVGAVFSFVDVESNDRL
jgi:NAD(P)-dependent dehydrogenase (short-subunit alcohol dehydrogenase family)